MSKGGMEPKFRYRLPSKLAVTLEMLVEGFAVVIMVGWDVHYFLTKDYRGMEEDGSFFTMFGYSISILGHFVALFLLITGVRVIIGPCTLTPQATDRRAFKRGVKLCRLWVTLEFCRFMLLLLGLSIRLMVFSLLAFDELTNMEIAKQSTVIIPLLSILLAMSLTNNFHDELEHHLKTKINCPPPFPPFVPLTTTPMV